MANRYKLIKGYVGETKPFGFDETKLPILHITTEEHGNRTCYISQDPESIDYQEYLAWVADGNTAEPADDD